LPILEGFNKAFPKWGNIPLGFFSPMGPHWGGEWLKVGFRGRRRNFSKKD